LEEKYTNEEAKSLKTGMAALLVILIGVVVTISHNASIQQKNMGDTYKIYANFGRTDGLEIGSPVRLGGINVGRVVASELTEHFHSKLTFEIDSDYKIPEDSSAAIVSSGLLGEKYVEIEIGGEEEYLKAGSTMSYTQDAMVLEELLDRIIAIGRSSRENKANTEEKENSEVTMPIANTEETEIKADDVKGDENE
jgi:phospholipid/cholesterol/gamma-HCH transport system substrate-binding protein